MSDANEVEIGNQASSVRFQDDIGQIKNSEGEAVLEVNNDQQIFLAKSSPQVYIDKFIDDDTMATASATSLATSESIKAYVDANAGGGGSGNFTDITVDTDTLVANVSGYTDKVGIGTATPSTKLHVIDASGGSYTNQITFGHDATSKATLGVSNLGQLSVESYDCHQFFRATNDTCVYHYLHHSTSGTGTGDGIVFFLNGNDGGIVNQEQGDLNILTTPSGNAKNCDGIRMARAGGSRIRLNLVEVTTSTSTLTSTDVNSIVCIDNSTPHATVTITLPDTADASQPIKSGCWFEFKDAAGNAGTNPITVQVDGGSSDTIDGASSIVLNQDYAAVRIFVHDTNKYMIGA